MAISFIGISTATDPASVTTLTLPVPAGTVAGDVMIAVTAGNTFVDTMLAEFGWAGLLAFPAVNLTLSGLAAQYRISLGGEPASYTFNWTNPQAERLGYMVVYRGLMLGFSWDAQADDIAGFPPQIVTRAARANPASGELLVHQPMYGRKQFGGGSPAIVTPDAALTIRGTINAFQQRLIATDEIATFGATFPARTCLIDAGGGSGNNFILAGLMRPLAAQAGSGSSPGFGFGASQPFG